jgi:hypothetical protein
MAQGRTNAAIADDLALSRSSVERHVSSIFSKLGLTEETHFDRRFTAVLTLLRNVGLHHPIQAFRRSHVGRDRRAAHRTTATVDGRDGRRPSIPATVSSTARPKTLRSATSIASAMCGSVATVSVSPNVSGNGGNRGHRPVRKCRSSPQNHLRQR